MNDPYRIAETSSTPPARRGVLRPVLWLTLFVTASANVVLSTAIGNPFVSSAFGLVALICATTLIVHHYRNR